MIYVELKIMNDTACTHSASNLHTAEVGVTCHGSQNDYQLDFFISRQGPTVLGDCTKLFLRDRGMKQWTEGCEREEMNRSEKRGNMCVMEGQLSKYFMESILIGRLSCDLWVRWCGWLFGCSCQFMINC